MMKLRQLKLFAYQRFSTLPEVLLKQKRGYGLLEVECRGIVFAIPLRSRLTHKYGFKTIFTNGEWCGLDYSKALIASSSDFSPFPFRPRNIAEYKKLRANRAKIESQFKQYVTTYIQTVESGGNVFRMCGFTTLINFHKQLGLESKSP